MTIQIILSQKSSTYIWEEMPTLLLQPIIPDRSDMPESFLDREHSTQIKITTRKEILLDTLSVSTH
jgi:hypothetical protein